MFFFFFNDTATTEIYTLSLHDALPISALRTAVLATSSAAETGFAPGTMNSWGSGCPSTVWSRSEEHTSELQSQFHLVCRLLLEKKKKKQAPTKSAYHSATSPSAPFTSA